MKNFKKLALALAAFAIAGSAYAADLPTRKAPVAVASVPMLTWTGFYVGLNAGYAWSNNSISSVAAAGPCDPAAGLGCTNTPNYSTVSALAATFSGAGTRGGFLGGGQIGYNWQLSSLILGLEADIQGLGGNRGGFATAGSIPVPNFPAFPVSYSASASRSLDFLGTVRGRLGFLPTQNLLLYVTGGLAYGGVNMRAFYSTTCVGCVYQIAPMSSASGSSTQVGYAIGGGAEWMFATNWSLKVEYMYYDLGRYTVRVPGIIGTNGVGVLGALFHSAYPTVSTRTNGNIVRAGINYHFNFGGAAPVVARY